MSSWKLHHMYKSSLSGILMNIFSSKIQYRKAIYMWITSIFQLFMITRTITHLKVVWETTSEKLSLWSTSDTWKYPSPTSLALYTLFLYFSISWTLILIQSVFYHLGCYLYLSPSKPFSWLCLHYHDCPVHYAPRDIFGKCKWQ